MSTFKNGLELTAHTYRLAGLKLTAELPVLCSGFYWNITKLIYVAFMTVTKLQYSFASAEETLKPT